MEYPSLVTWNVPTTTEWFVLQRDGRLERAISSDFVRITPIKGRRWPRVEVAAIDKSWSRDDSEWWLPDWRHSRIVRFE